MELTPMKSVDDIQNSQTNEGATTQENTPTEGER